MKFKEVTQALFDGKSPVLAVLIDPDKFNPELVKMANGLNVHCFLVGGSRLESGNLNQTVKRIKKLSRIPIILFPGDETQLSGLADGLFFPSLLSGRNPEYLIGKQVLMAPIIRRLKLPFLPMAYLLVNGQKISSTQKITGTKPLHPTESNLIKNTAIAAEQLGFKLLYLEAGSGAKSGVPAKLIRLVKKNTCLPIIVGGGIDSAEKVRKIIAAGANMIVVGNALEKNVYLLREFSDCFTSPEVK